MTHRNEQPTCRPDCKCVAGSSCRASENHESEVSGAETIYVFEETKNNMDVRFHVVRTGAEEDGWQ